MLWSQWTSFFLLFVLIYIYLQSPRSDFWKAQAPIDSRSEMFNCPAHTNESVIVFGGTGNLGKYIIEEYKSLALPFTQNMCIISFSKSPANDCSNCDVVFHGDIRDTKYVESIYALFSKRKQPIKTTIFSVKPSLVWTSYRTMVETNFAGVVEVANIARKYKVGSASRPTTLIYVSSIATTSHFVPSVYGNEADPAVLLTEYKSQYDLSKRLAEDYILNMNDPGNGFMTISLRVAGIVGGPRDEFFHHRDFPFQFTLHSPITIDYGTAPNIAQAITQIHKALVFRPLIEVKKISGEIFFYTGEAVMENATASVLAEVTGKPLLHMPKFLFNLLLDIWPYIRYEHDVYTLIDILQLADIQQTFDQRKFHAAFPEFKSKHTVLEFLKELYGPKIVEKIEARQEKINKKKDL